MKPASTLDAYRREPVGHFFADQQFLHFWPKQDLLGFVLGPRPNEDDVLRLTQCFEAELLFDTPHDSLIDARRLERVDVLAFNSLLSWVAEHREALGRVTRRQAVVRPEGFAGAVAVGFFAVQKPAYPVEMFEDVRAAMAWLENGTIALERELETAWDQAAGSPVLVALRAALSKRLADMDIAEVSRHLGLSERTLQRRLQEAGTNYIAEQNAARLRAAQALLMDTHMKLEAIAEAVGCASSQHLALLFRKILGTSPTAWRAAHARQAVSEAGGKPGSR